MYTRKVYLPLHIVVDEYAAGASCKILAKRFNVANRTICRQLISVGVKIRSRYSYDRSGGLFDGDRSYRKYGLKHQYGLSKQDYEHLLYLQGDGCKICGDIADKRFGLHVDHDHKTGKIRGLLCKNCNYGLGQFKDDAKRLERAAQYLLENV